MVVKYFTIFLNLIGMGTVYIKHDLVAQFVPMAPSKSLLKFTFLVDFALILQLQKMLAESFESINVFDVPKSNNWDTDS